MGGQNLNDGLQNLCWHTVKPAVSSCTQATSSIWLARVSTTQNFIEPYREFIVGGESRNALPINR